MENPTASNLLNSPHTYADAVMNSLGKSKGLGVLSTLDIWRNTENNARREDTLMNVSEPPLIPETNIASTEEEEPELWFEMTQNDITNGRGFRRTAMPVGGWPKIYLAASPTYNVAEETMSE